ncbi:MAG TPA: HAMP domain-containing sensor histidine kinase [Gemmatimonadales bacterium]|jgi:signal transduction histidine kinase|nr:HAMP domain-containing sensor histidine kinase [Gemmatimonadales bacterium]
MSKRGRLRRVAPGVAVILVALLAGLSVGTSWIVARHFREEAVTASRLYSAVFEGLNNPDPGATSSALIEIGSRVRSLGLPLVVTDTAGRVTFSANLPFTADPTDARLPEYVAQLDRTNPPIVTPGVGAVHYGPVPATGLLRTLGVLQGLTIVVMVLVAVLAYRNATTAQRDRLWVAMAREAAHQMGTPLTSLQGWIEQLRTAALAPGQVAEHLDADADRLQRVAQRFERIGNPARRDPVALGALAERVAGYYRSRLPRHSNAITLHVRAPSAGPTILGDPVLLEWALEAMVKNAIDALSGRGGTITLTAAIEHDAAVIRVTDDGPGVSREIRRTLFEPGISTKRGGWGIGLALARRVIEDAHEGTLTLEPTTRGTTFLMRFRATATT